MNHTIATMQGNMDIDPLSSYEYPTYNSYPSQTYPYPLKVQQSVYHQLYQQNCPNYVDNGDNNTNYMNHGDNLMDEPYKIMLPPLQKSYHEEVTKNNEQDLKPKQNFKPKQNLKPKQSLKKSKKEKNVQKSTYCSEKIKDATFKFYGCSVCNVSYTALHELDQHVTVHKNRMTSYRLRLRNQFKKKQIKKEKKKLKKMIKIKKENDFDVDIKPEDGYIGNERATDFIDNGSKPNAECNGNLDNGNPNSGNSAIESQNSQINTNNDISSMSNEPQNNDTSSMSNEPQNNDTNSLSNEMNENNENSVNNSKEHNVNSMDEAELNNLEKIYKCFACQKQFTLSYYLKLHVRSHTDEKPYTCSECGQSFITASKLGRHNKRIHLAERYQCRICFKIYARFQLLTAHFDKTHPEDKLEGEPYDYNAILPYLKELEEQLGAPEEDSKPPKTEDHFWEEQVGSHELVTGEGVLSPADIKEEVPDEDQKDLVPKLDILVEEVKVDVDVDVKIKQELSDEEGGGDGGDVPDDLGDQPGAGDAHDVKDEDSLSDEDYFPSNTWAAPPAAAAPPTAPPGSSPPSPRRRLRSRTCGVCHKSVSSASYMRVHMRTHTGERPFKCYKCGRGFITSSKMHRHVLTHEQDKDEDKLGDDDPKLEIDEDIADDDEKEGSKKPAKKKSKMKSKLSSKLKKEEKPRRKHQKRPHACEYCNQKFLHLNMLEVHKQSHAGEARVLRCQYCLQEAPDTAALRDHEAEHSGPKPYLCTICGKNYKKRETMVYHRKRHSPDKEFVCDICSKRFNAACKLHKHMVTHRGDKFVLRYECPVCAHMFNTKYHVHMHLNTHQKEGLILEENRSEILAMVLQNARKIPKQADAPANLTDIIPSDERSRICNICGEIFHHFYYLEEHLKSHGSRIAVADVEQADEKKYICPICNKGFKLHYYLKLHSFTHSKEKPFICQQCGKGFITKGKLKRHLETHTGLKKYQCHICYKFFTRPSYLRIHIRTIHGTQDYNFRFDKGYGLGSLAMSAMAMSDVSQNSI